MTLAQITFSPEQSAHWARCGWLVDQTSLPARLAPLLAGWADAVAALPETDDPSSPTQHHEGSEHGDLHARTEHFVHLHSGLRDLVVDGPLQHAASALLCEPVVLYKEKLNYKHPGGAGFAPHQDATAYRFVDRHITAMVAIDDATPANGGMELASGWHHELLATDGDGCIAPEVAADLPFEPLTVRRGDVLWFHSLAPHQSGPNRSATARRAFFFTFNAAAHGDLRERYYADRAEQLRQHDGVTGASRVSTIGHFRGVRPTGSAEPGSATRREPITIPPAGRLPG